MRTMTVAVLAGALALGGVGRAVADEGEGSHEGQSITMAELPAVVQTTLQREARGAQIEELTKQTRENGRVAYGAELVKDGKGRNILLNADGKILKRGTPHEEKSEPEHQGK